MRSALADRVQEVQRRPRAGAAPGQQDRLEAWPGLPRLDCLGDRFQDGPLPPQQVARIDSGPVEQRELEQQLRADVSHMRDGRVQPLPRGLPAPGRGVEDGALRA
jgi:hypothetical protein